MYNLRGTKKGNAGRGSGNAGRGSGNTGGDAQVRGAFGRGGSFGRGGGIAGTSQPTTVIPVTTNVTANDTQKTDSVPVTQVKNDSIPKQYPNPEPRSDAPDPEPDPETDSMPGLIADDLTLTDATPIVQSRSDEVQMKMGRDNLRNLLALFDCYTEIDERLLAILEELGIHDDFSFMDYTCADITDIFNSIFFSESIRTEGNLYDNDDAYFEYTINLTATIVLIHEFFANIDDVDYRKGKFAYHIGYDTLIENELASIDAVTAFVLENDHHLDDLNHMFGYISDRIIDGIYRKEGKKPTKESTPKPIQSRERFVLNLNKGADAKRSTTDEDDSKDKQRLLKQQLKEKLRRRELRTSAKNKGTSKETEEFKSKEVFLV